MTSVFVESRTFFGWTGGNGLGGRGEGGKKLFWVSLFLACVEEKKFFAFWVAAHEISSFSLTCSTTFQVYFSFLFF